MVACRFSLGWFRYEFISGLHSFGFSRFSFQHGEREAILVTESFRFHGELGLSDLSKFHTRSVIIFDDHSRRHDSDRRKI